MSQILINSLSKVQDTVVNAMQTKVSPLNPAMDKSADFRTAFEKTLNKVDKAIDKGIRVNQGVNKEAGKASYNSVDNSAKEVKTLGNIKIRNKSEENNIVNNIDLTNVTLTKEELSELRGILKEVIGETNVETSLDLTLTKDVSELVEQFKKILAGSEAESEEDSNVLIEELQKYLSAYLEKSANVSEEKIDLNIETSGEVVENLTTLAAGQKNALDALQKLVSKMLPETKELNLELDNDTVLLKDFELVDENSDSSLNDLINSMVNEVSEEVVKPSEDVLTQDLELPIEEDILKELHIESIQAEAGNSDGEALLQQQSAQEHVVKAMINQEVETFDIKLEKTMDAQPVQAAPTKAPDVNPSKILNQIVKQMEGMQNGSKVNIVLNPESLGKVNVQLLSTKEGLMAQFTVSTPEAKDALMKGLDNLKESLLSHGVNVDNVSVKMNESQKSSYNPDWTEQEGSRGGNKEQGRSNKDEKEKGLFEQMMAQANEENGNV